MKWTDRFSQLRARLESLLANYGTLALITYFGLYAAVAIVSTALAYHRLQPTTWGGFLGLFGGVWLVTRGTWILRVLLTLLITPALARATRLKRLRG